MTREGNDQVIHWPEVRWPKLQFELGAEARPVLFDVDRDRLAPGFLNRFPEPLGTTAGGDFPNRLVVKGQDTGLPLTVTPTWIAVAHGPLPQVPRQRDFLKQALVFNGTGKPLDELPTGAPVPTELEICGYLPRLAVGLTIDSEEAWLPLALHLHDGRTGNGLISANRQHRDVGPNWISARFDLGMWHPAPVLLLADLAHGPVEEGTMSPRPEASVAVGASHLVLKSIDNGEAEIRKRNRDLYMNSRRSATTSAFLFQSDQPGYLIPYRLEFLDGAGHLIPSSRLLNHQLVVYQVAAPAEMVTLIRFIHYPHITRFVFPLEAIPGLPKENLGLQNLFQTAIPHCWLKDPGDLARALSFTTQLQLHHQGAPGISAPQGPFAFQETTPAELLNRYLELLPRGYRATVEPEKGLLLFTHPFR